MGWLLVIGAPSEDPHALVQRLLELGELTAVEGGWIISLDTESARAKRASRDRQARYRRRKNPERYAERVTPDEGQRYASYGPEIQNPSSAASEYESLSALEGQEREIHSGIGDERYASPVTRDDAVTRNGRNGNGADPTADPEAWLAVPLTDTDREEAQARIREMRDELNALRKAHNKPEAT